MAAVVGTPVPRGNGGPAGDLVEAAPVVGYKGFVLQLTTAGQAAAGAPGMVAAVAVAGAAPVNLAATAGGLPNLMNAANVQADHAARFAAAQHVMHGGNLCIRWDSQIPGGDGWHVPVQASSANAEHTFVVREISCVIEHCQAINNAGIFVAAIAHIDNSRMPGGNNKHAMRNLFEYINNATQAQLAADNLDFILYWEWSMFDTLSGGEPGMRNGAAGPIIIGNPGTPGDMHAEGMLFVKPGYESPEDADPNALAAWTALNAKLREWGFLDGSYTQGVAPFVRSGQYFNPLVLPSWKKRGDRNDYPAIFETHNYFMRLKMGWRSGGGGRSIAAQANQMALMGVIPQRAVANTDFPRHVPTPITAPPAGTNPLLVTRCIAVAAAPP